jgi:hypothetical protein
MAAETADAHLRAHVLGTRQILERVAAITGVWATAVANDPEIATMWEYDEDPRFVVQAAAAKALIAKPGARDDVTAEHAADLLFGLLSPELYLVFVRDRCWSPEAWERWAVDTLRAQLCR